MPNLEYVIRPYQSPTPFGTIIIPSAPSQGRDRATITWGATAQGTMPPAEEVPTASPETSYQMQCCNDALQENSRSTHAIRIIGSDGESYVDVERPYQMKLKRKTKTQCDGPLDQISLVNQGINAVLNDFTDAFSEAASKFGTTDENCHSQWNLSG